MKGPQRAKGLVSGFGFEHCFRYSLFVIRDSSFVIRHS